MNIEVFVPHQESSVHCTMYNLFLIGAIYELISETNGDTLLKVIQSLPTNAEYSYHVPFLLF